MIIRGKPLLVNVVIIFIAVSALFLIASNMANNRLVQFFQHQKSNSMPNSSDLIVVEKPKSGELVESPLLINGRARGYWYFEASFPVRIFDDNGVELGVAIAQAGGEWMTEDFVPFVAILEFKKPSTKKGVLVLQKDNPSGLPEHDAELRIPIVFDLENLPAGEAGWRNKPVVPGGCLATGCSGQICSDEDVISTCEYKAEYACYKTAKCERQEDGKCGWTPTEDLVTCLGEAFQAE